MKEEVKRWVLTDDITGEKMHDEDDNPDIDFSLGSSSPFYIHLPDHEDFRGVLLEIQGITLLKKDGSEKEVYQLSTSSLHKLLGPEDGE